MTFSPSPDDRADPADQHAVRARVPDHIARGVFSTGVIVMTAPTEFVIDFIQNLGRPHQVVARVIMPHPVLPQFVDALLKNIELYRGRYGNLPQPNLSGVTITSASGMITPDGSSPASGAAQAMPEAGASSRSNPNADSNALPGRSTDHPSGAPDSATDSGPGVGPGIGPGIGPGVGAGGRGGQSESTGPGDIDPEGSTPHQTQPAQPSLPPQQPANTRRASAQEIYDDLKLRDEVLSGSYANAVMIGHGPHEFSFDFITNFYPHSAVSARVFLAAGQVGRLADSLKGAWDQIRHRFQSPPDSDIPPYSP